jgi:hypothetical protein
MPVARMLAEMDSRELTEWQEWFRIEGPPESRADYRAAIVAQTVALGAGAKDVAAADFVPRFEVLEEPRQSIAAQKTVLTLALGHLPSVG